MPSSAAAPARLLISFSGGRTSGYMMKRLLDEYRDRYEIRVAFMNTSREREKTLVFVDRCSMEWGIEIVWLEAVVHHDERLGCTHRIVDFNSACRDGSVFEEVIKKYGIPNKAYPHCTRELKLNPLRSYLESIGWQDCLRAVGIRVDELKRLRKDAEANLIVYPLAHWFPTTKPEIMDWWEDQPFDLGLQDFEGNCQACWKKSLPKLCRIAVETPEAYEWTSRMESTYGLNGHNIDGTKRTFFREHRSSKQILLAAEIVGGGYQENTEEDSGCSESCEVFGQYDLGFERLK